MNILDDIDRMEQLTSQADLEKSSASQRRLSNEDIDSAFASFTESSQLSNSKQSSDASDFVPGINRGLQELQASAYGIGALTGKGLKNIGFEETGKKLQDLGLEGYQRNIEESKQYPAKYSFKDVYTGKAGIGGAIDWAQGTLGSLVPSMAEAAVGAAIGTLSAPGPGTAVGAFAGRTILKKSIDEVIKKTVKEGTEKVVEDQIRKQVTSQALKKLGGKIGMGAAVFPMETGIMYAELLESHDVDAPGTAMLFGSLATAMEYAGGNSKLVDTFVDALAKGSTGMAKKSAREILTNIPQEAMQEGGQELMNILNTVVNTDEKLLTGANLERIIESMAAGAVGGGAAGAGASYVANSQQANKKFDLRAEQETALNKQVDNIFSFGEEKVNTTLQTLQDNVTKNAELLSNQEALDKYAMDANIDPDILVKQLVEDNNRNNSLIQGIQKRFTDQQLAKDQEIANLSPEQKQVFDIQNRIKTQREESALNINEQINGINEQLKTLRQQAAQEQDVEKRNGLYENVFGLIDNRDALLDKQKQVVTTTEFTDPKKADEIRQEKESFYQQLWSGGVDKDAVESAQVFNEKTAEQQDILDRITTQIANTQDVQKKQDLQKLYDGLFQTFERDANEAAQTFQEQDLSQFDQIIKSKDSERLNNIIKAITVEQDPQVRQTMYEQLFMEPIIKDAAESASVFATQSEDADMIQRRKELQQTINTISQESDPAVRQKLYDQMFLQPGVKNAEESAKIFNENIQTIEQQEEDRKQREGEQFYNEVFAQNQQPLNIEAPTENTAISAEESAKTFEQAGMGNGQTSPFTDERQVLLTDKQQIIVDKNNFEIAKLKQTYNTTIDRDERINVLNQIDALEKINSGIRTPVEQFAQFQTSNQEVIGKVSIEDIQKAFPKQTISQAEDGTISVQFKNGKGLTIKSIQQANADFIKLALETGQMSKNGKILGITVGNEILLNDNFADNKTLWHENKHVLDNLGLITADDDSALNREFNKLRKAGKLEFALSTHKDPKQAMIENRANMFAQIMVNRDAYRATSFGKVIQRVMDFFQQLLSFGKQSVAGLAREVESGRVYERQGNDAGIGYDANFNINNAKAFFSKLQQISTDKFSGMKAQSVEPFLLKQGVKKTEIEATGLKEWLASMKPTDKVTKNQLSEFAQANTVEFEDVVLGGKLGDKLTNQESRDMRDKITALGFFGLEHYPAARQAILRNADWAEQFGVSEDQELVRIGTKYRDIHLGKLNILTHFDTYTEPGAVKGSYREMFVTAPSKPTSLQQDARKVFGKDFTDLTKEEMAQLSGKYDKGLNSWTDGHSQYSDIKNPIVRIRFNEITGQNGERILRVEEMQGPSADNQSKMPKHLKDNIYQTGVKRILTYAKENGFDGVALATKPGRTAGETQADRYSLEQQVSRVKYDEYTDAGVNYDLFRVWDNDENLLVNEKLWHDKLDDSARYRRVEDYVGKEIAEKIWDGQDDLSGLDLRVGGEGLKQLYDNDLPNIFKAWSKQQMATINGMPYISVANVPNSYPMFITKDSTPEQIAQAVNPAIKYAGVMNGIPNIVEDVHNFTITLPDGKQPSFSIPGEVTNEKLTKQLNKVIARFKQNPNENVKFQVAETLEQVISDDVYNQMFTERNNLVRKIGQTLRMRGTEFKQLLDKGFGSISTRLKNVDPMLSAEIRNLDFRTSQKIVSALRIAHPLLDATKKMSAQDKFVWDAARRNSDTGKIKQIAEKYGIAQAQENLRNVLNQIRQDAIDVGYDVGFIDEYWPRIIKDQEGFLQATKGISNQPVFTNALKVQADKLGLSVDRFQVEYPEVAADIISNTILGRNLGLGGPGNIQARQYETVPPELNKYYMDSDAALMQYIYSMTKKIEVRRFFGKVPERISGLKADRKRKDGQIITYNEMLKTATPENKAELNKRINDLSGDLIRIEQELDKYKLQRDYTENIGAYIDDLILTGRISKDEERIVRNILEARFHEHGTTGLINAYKNIAYIDVMGSPISAITQIGDLAWAMYVGKVWTPRGLSNTVKNIGKSITKSSEITKEDLGIERIAQEFADGTTLGNAVSWVFKKVQLERMDSIGKEVLINNALDNYKAMVQTEDGRTSLTKYLKPIFGAESDEVIQDLVANNHSDNVKMLLYHRLLDFQPVALSEMPEQYLKSGNGRIFYMLKTYTLKQFDVFRNEAWHKIKSGERDQVIEGIGNMVKLVSLLALANAGADELKDLLLGKDVKFKDHVIENFITMSGASRYVKIDIKKEGLGTALLKQILPPFKFVNSLSKDVAELKDQSVAGDVLDFNNSRIIESIPIGGKLYYWHYGRGEDYKKSSGEKSFKDVGKEVDMFKRQLENADNKREFMYANIGKFKQMKLHENFQSALSRNQAVINKLKKVPETTNVIERLGQLKEQREALLDRYFEASKDLK